MPKRTSNLLQTLLPLMVFLLSPVAAVAETIEGLVEFQGVAPQPEKLRRNSDPFCAAKVMFDPSIQLKGNKLKDVWVRVTAGAPDQPGSPDKTVEIHQKQCMYEPRVVAMQAGNKVLIQNDDPVLHNVHAYSAGDTIFNRAMPSGSPALRFDRTTSQSTSRWKGVLRWKCDVHAWMGGYLAVAQNPFFAVSDGSGAFRIENVPPGHYTLTAWHEKYGEKTVEITVEPGQAATTVFQYRQKLTQTSPPEPKKS